MMSAALDLSHVWHVSVERYHEMVEQGIFRPEDRVELPSGTDYQTCTIYNPGQTVPIELDGAVAGHVLVKDLLP